jgi:hypothetical protein
MDDSRDQRDLDQLTSIEELDKTLMVVGIRAWAMLFFFLALIALVLFWAFFGKLPIAVSGKCLVFDSQNIYEIRNPSEGVVKEIRFFGGERVKKGETLILYENPDSEIVAPVDGRILWVDSRRGAIADPHQIAIAFQGQGPVKDLKIIGFLPLFSGLKVKVGMQALCSLQNINPEKYGLLKAKVVEIFPFPVGPEERYMQKIPSKELLDYLTGYGKVPILLVIAAPELDPNTASGLAWTSEKGPPESIFPGSVGAVEIVLKNVTPISYVLPKK